MKRKKKHAEAKLVVESDAEDCQDVQIDHSKEIEKEEQALLKKWKDLQSKKKKPVQKSQYAPSKPAMEIDEETKLYDTEKVLQSNKVAASLFDMLDLKGSSQDKGLLIDSTTVDIRLKKAIWSGAFFDLGLLAPRCEMKFIESSTTAKTLQKITKPASSFDEWENWFLTYCIIYTSSFPYAASELFGYIKRIKGLWLKAKNSFVWRTYDEEFRKWKASNPETPWHDLKQDLLNIVEEIHVNANNSNNSQTSYTTGNTNNNAENFSNGFANKKNGKGVKFPKNGMCHAWNRNSCKAG
ncbi:MAG: hypothetical protein GY705_29640, partial [Bacteroidetes bacterium]|nr:hypothetical protein [Bacteroidota bacterium]